MRAPGGAATALGLVAMLFAGCRPDEGTGEVASTERARPEIPAAALRNAAYPSQYLDEGTVRLTDGIFEDTARRAIVMFLPEYAVGDLDGDDSPDAAVVLATNTGGSGTFHDLVVVPNTDGVVRGEVSLFLGDRVPVDRIRIVDGVIEIELTMHGPGDAMCCPTLEVTRRFRLSETELVEIEPPAGTPDYTP